MNRHPSHRSPANMRSVFLLALALYVLVSFALALALGAAAGAPDGPLHATPGLGL
jgi:hypothetical protein